MCLKKWRKRFGMRIFMYEITAKKEMFTGSQLVKLIIPLIIEQMLGVLVGMADTVMVSSVGEAAVSGVSLVDTINVLYFTVFSALTTGGAVVASQYIGAGDKEASCKAANQLLTASVTVAMALMLISLFGHKLILRTVFGKIDSDVMANAQTYFLILSLSLPFMAMYNSGASLFRSMGNSKISMVASLVMNVLNIGGNALFLYGFHMGVAGVATASLISRIVAAAILLFLLRNREYILHLEWKYLLHFDRSMVKKILHIGVPNSLETGIFQIGKILVLSLVTGFGSKALAANAVSNTVATFQTLSGGAIGLGVVTVVGQCVGAGEFGQAKRYTLKLLATAYSIMTLINIFAILNAPWLAHLFHLTPEAVTLAVQIIRYHGICCILIWPAAFTLPNALRAAGDVKYPMVVAIFSMWVFRVGFGYLIGQAMGVGVLGVWIAMSIDWVFRAICFGVRFAGKKWQQFSVVRS